MKKYELNLHFSGKLEKEEAQKKLDSIKKKIDGKIIEEIELKKINLAYPIKKETLSFFASLIFETLPGKILELRDELKHQDGLLRFLVSVKMPLEEKKPHRSRRKVAKKPIKKKLKLEKKDKKEEKPEEIKEVKKTIKKEPKIKLEDIDKSLEKLLEKEI